MQPKPIITYSRKRKRSPSIVSAASSDANSPTKEATRAAVEAAKSLPSPPASSSPRQLRDVSLNSVPHPNASHRKHETRAPQWPAKLHPLKADAEANADEYGNKTKAKGKATTSTAKSQKGKRKQQKLTQLTLDLGQRPPRQTTRCPICGMEYVPSNPEDAKLHGEFHSASVGGVDVPAGVGTKWRVVGRCVRRVGGGGTAKVKAKAKIRKKESVQEGLDVVVEVGRHDALAVRNFARRVLAVAEREMGAVGIEEEGLWSSGRGDFPCAPNGGERRAGVKLDVDGQHGGRDRHKVYLYIQGSKCIGLCLAERISAAFKVQPGFSSTTASSSISTTEISTPAVLGISRIWVSREFRGYGIARELLDTARQRFLYGAELPKDDVAFSQPTESGGRLARAWFGKDHGWMVYDLSRC